MKLNVQQTQAVDLRSRANDEAWKSALRIVDSILGEMDRFSPEEGSS